MTKNIYKILSLLFFLTATISVLFLTGCDKEVSRSTVEPTPQGFIYINSSPPGFTIYQNGKNTGRITPDSITFIEPGVYEITLKRKYYKDTTVTVSVTEEMKSTVDINYFANPSMFGNLALYSNPPGASILFDSILQNSVTPDTFLNLLPAAYKIKYRKENHREVEFDAIVQSSKTNIYFEELRDTSVWIDYQVFNSGIQSNVLTDIAIDNNIKWIGSLTAGLIKYDESEFINFNTINSSIPSNIVNAVTISPNNDIWIGTNKGLAVFNGASWITYNQLNSDIPTDLVNAIQFDNMNVAWIGTSGGLARFDGVTWKMFNDSQLRIWVNDFKIDNNGVIWIGTSEFGIVSLIDSSFIYYPDSVYNYLTNRISSVDIDQFGNVWFCHLPDSGRRSGVSYFDGTMFTNNFIGNADNIVSDILIDEHNNKWISSQQGFAWYDMQNNIQFFNTLNSLISSDQTIASVRDFSGAVWITTSGGGLNKFKPPN